MDSFSGPIPRNHSNFSRKLSTANGLSSKNAYDDVFTGLPKVGPSSTFSSRLEDYSEIFSTSRVSSIPVLDLSEIDDTSVSADFRNSKPDYSSIFVGFSDQHIGVSYDQLFSAPNDPSAKTRTSSANIVPDQFSDSSISMEQHQSYDEVKQFNLSYNKTNQEIKDERKVTTHVTELRAVPGFTCFIDETTPPDKTRDGKNNPPAINDIRPKMDSGATSAVPKKETRGFVRSRNGSSWDGTYSNGKLFVNPNANGSNLKSHPSDLEKNNSFFKTSSKLGSKKDDPRTDARDCSAGSSDEELDLNSSAAASVAALKNAIEKAQESIRFAKELMEKKDGTQNFSKRKSRSKAKDRRESIVAHQRSHTEKQNNDETVENATVQFRTKDTTAERNEAETGFFELVNRGNHRRAVSAFEQLDRREFPKIETNEEVLVHRETTAEEAEVLIESSESKADMKREESSCKVLQDEERNLDKLETTFVVPELGEINGMGSKEADRENHEEEKMEEDEFFETQDWDDGKSEEEMFVVEDGCLELVVNEHKQEVLQEQPQQQQQIVEERSKEDIVIEENDEDVLANRLEEAFHWVENEIRLSEVFDSNESKQIDETPVEVIETHARQEIEKDVKIKKYERTESEEMVESDGCDKKENEEVNIIVGEGEEEGDKSSEKEISENKEMEVDEEESKGKKPQENGEEGAVGCSRVSDASTSEILLEEEASQQLEINNDFVKTSPKESDADVDEKASIMPPLQEDDMSISSSSTDSDTGESQVEQNTTELASNLAKHDAVVDDLRESEEVVREEVETIQIEEIRTRKDIEEEEKERVRAKEELGKKRERERERMAVDRAIREARERAFADAREKAERANIEKVNAQIRQRFMAEARDKLEKASQKDEAKQKGERAAVERATQEARKRALEKAALSQKASASTSQPIPEASRHSSDSPATNSESYLRSKAKLEKHQRIMERAAQALEEKNMRDTIALKEQAERNRLSASLDADIKRWSNGKEGNLRALLSTLQYILGTSSGWQPVALTEIVTTSAVKKAYRKATLCVHPDKLQQRGASIQHKYICEKVFDLLKAAWNKFNAEER